MAVQHDFEHLPLLLRYQGAARLPRGGKQSDQTKANRNARSVHSTSLLRSAQQATTNWRTLQEQRTADDRPVIARGVPILLKVDPNLDLDLLRQRFEFEIVAEQEDGFVIVASQDFAIAPFLKMVNDFAQNIRGSATVASVHTLFDDEESRLKQILSDTLFAAWPTIVDANSYIVDVGIACAGTKDIPARQKRGKRDTDAEWAAKESKWSQERSEAYSAWDALQAERENEILRIVEYYKAEILQFIDGQPFDAAILPDSFSIRLRIGGRGLKDFVLSYPYIFEVIEPDDIALPQRSDPSGVGITHSAAPIIPSPDAPAVCVIDSGIQEQHVLLAAAIDQPTSYCFLPGINHADVADYVRPDGHGTRVAGAVLYGESVARSGKPQLPLWVQNARVLNEHCKMPVELFPPAAIRAAIERFHGGPRHTRIFNHSINSDGACRTRYMSAWASEIDALSAAFDVLVVQSAGNLPDSAPPPLLGFKEHLLAGREYPQYLCEPSCRIANPGQSLQALTVGSVCYGAMEKAGWRTIGQQVAHPSAFTRAGFGIWSVIKPEVVEFAGDGLRTKADPVDARVSSLIVESCPELVRSTMYPPGPAVDRDRVGTSFAVPKVARIAAKLQSMIPNEPTLLYRALIVQSARWPEWAQKTLSDLRRIDPKKEQERRRHLNDEALRLLRYIGYGLPDEGRATTNTDYRATFVTNGEQIVKARECHFYQVPIPDELRRPSDEYEILVEVTLSYVAQPRRTRRHLRRYLSTWVDWKSSKLGERLDEFRLRAMKEVESDLDDEAEAVSDVLPWTLHESPRWGTIRDVKRNAGTVQKDWAVVKSSMLPDHFCIAVMGHPGWSRDPDTTARYSMAVSLEIVGKEIPIYEPLRSAVLELQSEIEGELEIEVPDASAE